MAGQRWCRAARISGALSPELAGQAKILRSDIEVLCTSGYTQDALI